MSAVSAPAVKLKLRHHIWLPTGSRLIVGSLDKTARHHTVQLDWKRESSGPTVSGHTHTASAFQFCRMSRVPKLLTTEKPKYDGRALPPVECRNASNARRFAVPFFAANGSVFERFVVGQLIAAGSTTRLYLDESLLESHAGSEVSHEIIHLIEIGLREFVEEQLVPIADVDEDQHLTIVMCRLADAQTTKPGEEPLRGCVREKDFLNRNWAFGGDIIYLDVEQPRDLQLAAVLAHELAHAATFSAQRMSGLTDLPGGKLPFWMNEGIAHFLEHSVCNDSDNLRQRLNRYSRQPNAYSLVLPDDYLNLRVRRGPARAAALSFMSFCASTRSELLSELVKSQGEGLDTVEQITGESFDTLFREWSIHESSMTREIPISVSDSPQSVSIAGTSFATFSSPRQSGFIQITAHADAALQVTVIEQSQQTDRLTLAPDTASRN